MHSKKQSRFRRARKTRAKLRELRVNRLTVHRTPRHIYAQIIGPDSATTLVSASTLDKALRKSLESTGNIEAAAAVGKLIGERAREKGIEQVSFDRSGFRYHGRVKALADGAREAGLKI